MEIYSRLNGVLSIISIFVLAWLFLLGEVEVSVLSMGLFVFFIVIAAFSWFVEIGLWDIQRKKK